MKLKDYLKDKILEITFFLISIIIIFLILVAFKINYQVTISIIIITFFTYVILLLIDYFRKKNFYRDLLCNIASLDKSYLVLETISEPNFYEGKLLYQALYEINKSMNENVKSYLEQLSDFKEYIEMWIHEVKIPLSSLMLNYNNKNIVDVSSKLSLKRLENYVEQILYYVRSEHASKDYLIKEVDLSKVVKNVGLKYMDDLLNSKIAYKVSNVNNKVLTDSKWLEFILSQIVNNSIKYKRNIKNSYIKITSIDYENKTTLLIEDNGIGIPSCDINQVFDKTFTGINGRTLRNSTGMGLFIAKNLCEKLGHKIEIESKEGEYTKVYLTFFKNKYYDVLK